MERQAIPYDAIADRYEESRGGRPRAEALASAITPWLQLAQPVLDVGTGTGIVADCLVERGHEVLGLDLSMAMLHRAAPRLRGRIAAGDARTLPLRARSVAGVVFCWSLHLVGDPVAALAEARRVVMPRGPVVVVSSAQEGPQDEIHQIMRGLDAIASVTRDDSQIQMIRSSATHAGLVPIGETWAEQRVEQSPAQVAGKVSAREFNMLWDVDAETWSTKVVPIIDALFSLDEPDRPRVRHHRNRVLAFSSP